MQKMLIFGGAGSLGHEMIKRYINNYQIVIASRDEAKHWDIINKFKHNNLTTVICDVRDEKRVQEVISQEKPENIIIAQALKHVDVCEKFPQESIHTNILGVANILNSIKILSLMNLYSPKLICFISTDKSCEPISVYGLCKSISEKLILNISEHFENTDTRAIIVRYGNVLSSKGSIIPLLLNQATDPTKNKFTLTHVEMTRFIMTLSEAVSLIDTTIMHGKNGDLWVPKLKSMKILDLMKFFSKRFDKPYEIVGIRPGEKLHEIMISLEEAIVVDTYLGTHTNDEYFIFNKKNKFSNKLSKEYSSSDYILPYNELEKYLINYLDNVEE